MEHTQGDHNAKNSEPEACSLDPDKRQRVFTAKALQNAVDDKRKQLVRSKNKLTKVLSASEKLDAESELNIVLKDITTASEEFRILMEELYAQDKIGLFGEEALLADESVLLNRAYIKIEKTKNSQTDKSLDNKSMTSRHSRRSRLSRASSCSTARIKAMADAAAARESAEFDRLLAQKEMERKKREIECEVRRKEEKAQFEMDSAILSANKRVAAANAKLRAIDQAIEREEFNDIENRSIEGIAKGNIDQRTRDWVDENSAERALSETTSSGRDEPHNVTHPLQNVGLSPQNAELPSQSPRITFDTGQYKIQPNYASTPYKDVTEGQLIESLTAANQQIVAGLAKQNLPKCQPDVFSGDATLFHPWKASFKAMIDDVKVSPIQELNYLRTFTSGNVQRLVDNYRKRQSNHTLLLKELWKELEKRFGSAAIITNTLLDRMRQAAAFHDSDNARLQHFADLCADVESQLSNLSGLACLNYPSAIQPIASKLPASLKAKWEKEIAKHSETNDGEFPGFDKFSKLMKDQSDLKNNPNILAGSKSSRPPATTTNARHLNKKALKSSAQLANNESRKNKENENKKRCVFHDREGHDITECKAFAAKSLDDRSEWIFKAGLCYRCLSSGHVAAKCEQAIACTICGDERHVALLHKERPKEISVDAKCTSICSHGDGGVSCSKTVLVDVYDKSIPHYSQRVYAIIDEQSNTSMISSELADSLGARGPLEQYFLSTCSKGREVKYGRRVVGLVVRGVNGMTSDLPTLVECGSIPQDKSEVPTPSMARRFKHLRGIASEIPPLDKKADIHLLIGRDAPELLKVRESRNGSRGAPWAQRLDLGWTIIGQVCLDLVDGPAHVKACRTSTQLEDRQTKPETSVEMSFELTSCPNEFRLTDSIGTDKQDVFRTSREDNEPSLSCDDRKFLQTMENGVHKNAKGNWEMPLPFRHESRNLPNNRQQAVQRLNSLLRTLRRKPQMAKDYVEFMKKIIDKGHASPAPETKFSGKTWYLPHFGVYHPKKPGQIRVVFDSSAEYDGVSLNKELIPGPDMMNSLFGVLVRFRKETIAVMCDIEQMFHSFFVNPSHRDFLRFLWFEDNDLNKQIIEYRMNVHLFGNGPSPAVATFGLRKTATDGEELYGKEAANFVHRNFYVDDGLVSLPSAEQAIKLIRSAQSMLATANLRLHKVVSCSVEVMEAFPTEDRAKDIRDLDLRHDCLPSQRSLGVYWNLESDTFTFKVAMQDKPFTRRGVLSIVNSIYDPLGFGVPVLLEGRLLLQQLVSMGKKSSNASLGWDDPLPGALLQQWQRWRNSLPDLEKVLVPRCYKPKGFGKVKRAEIHAFSDASKDAIGVAVYLRLINETNEVSTALIFGQSKVAPIQATSIPRLELCGAVLATQAVSKILKEIDIAIDDVTFYTDSKVVLGYIQNESKRFYVYVANRVQLIRRASDPSQWMYVDTKDNPADLATRCMIPNKLIESCWLTGPCFLRDSSLPQNDQKQFLLQEHDPEVRKEAKVCAARIQKKQSLGSRRFERFSTLASLQRAVANLIVFIKEFKRRHAKPIKETTERSQNALPRKPTVKELQQAIDAILKATQQDTYKDEYVHYYNESHNSPNVMRTHKVKTAPKSNLYPLDPFIGKDGILRVGGRLRRSHLDYAQKHPLILPKGHHVSRLVVLHYHNQVHHQGRQITHGAIRQAGFWLVGGHRLVASEIGHCVTCKKLRGPALKQWMADLPPDRTEVAPPFSNVGFDVFGPWHITTRKTRGGVVNSKRWGLVFTCLTSRAIHIEVLESMDTSSFICALRRFFAIRGPAVLLRCDRGTNFIGAKTELEEALKESKERQKVEEYVNNQGCEWLFNPPHASHFGGVWERQIGTIRRILDAMFRELGPRQLTHELLVTLMAEVSAIVNARPITAIPTDTDDPQPLSPSMLLTMKKRPLGPLPGKFVPADVYARRRWRRVQYLADQFWLRWRREYLPTLQPRQKWQQNERCLIAGDIVLMKEQDAHRNEWPMGRIKEAIKGDDGLVRKAKVEITRGGKKSTYLRPIKELVLLVAAEQAPDSKGQEN